MYPFLSPLPPFPLLCVVVLFDSSKETSLTGTHKFSKSHFETPYQSSFCLQYSPPSSFNHFVTGTTMPPYSGNDSVIAPTSGRHNAAYYADVAPSTKQGGSANDDNSASEASQSPSRMNMLLDFNPCTSMTSAASSMTSAVFKTRTCKYCGQGCNKVGVVVLFILNGKGGNTGSCQNFALFLLRRRQCDLTSSFSSAPRLQQGTCRR